MDDMDYDMDDPNLMLSGDDSANNQLFKIEK